ncbi:MAG: hypothetical protein EA376_09335 [Phycisphaeraceae bacterium]|nr:MAG: hypothetical protein EA376_09335 [Phycisphaeraceae bacterium]
MPGLNGYDRFGRIARQSWVDGALTTHSTDTTVPNIPPIVALAYGYDKMGNRTHMYDARPGASRENRDWEYAYDGLNRLIEARRGVRDGSWADGPGGERWSLDMLGNWGEFEKDLDGDGAFGGVNDSLQEREHNFANEITKITDYADPTNPATGDDLEFGYTDTGAMAEQEQLDVFRQIKVLAYTHDAWQRLVRVEFGVELRAEYEYNGLNWRVVKRADMQESPDGTLTQERVMLYDSRWRIVEEWIDDDLDENPGIDRIAQQIWGPRYVDDAILRRQSTNLGNDDPNTTWETLHYYLTDALFSPVALVTHTGALAERVSYTPYGVARHHWAHDVNGDGAVTTDSGDPTSDVSLANDALNETIADAGYNVDADVNRDGVVDSTDINAITAAAAAALPDGMVSDADAGGGGADSAVGHASTLADQIIGNSYASQLYLSTALGRSIQSVDALFIVSYYTHKYEIRTNRNGLQIGRNVGGSCVKDTHPTAAGSWCNQTCNESRDDLGGNHCETQWGPRCCVCTGNIQWRFPLSSQNERAKTIRCVEAHELDHLSRCGLEPPMSSACDECLSYRKEIDCIYDDEGPPGTPPNWFRIACNAFPRREDSGWSEYVDETWQNCLRYCNTCFIANPLIGVGGCSQ